MNASLGTDATAPAVRHATPALTVVVPTYNRPEYLGECLAAIGRESYTGFRLVVLDNASSRDYSEVLRAHRALGIDYVRHPVSIGPGNIPFALENYRDTEFLTVFHDDDLMHPKMLEWQVRILQSDPEVTLVATSYLEFADGMRPPFEAWDGLVEPSYEVFDAAELSRTFMRHDPVCFGSTMYRTTALAAAQPDPDRFAMYGDRPYLLGVAAQGRCAFIRDPLVMYRVHGAQDSQASDVLTLSNLVELMKRFRDTLPSPLSSADRELFERYSTWFMIDAYRMLSGERRPRLLSYVATCRSSGVLRLRHVGYRSCLQLLRYAGAGRLVDAGVRAKRLLRGR